MLASLVLSLREGFEAALIIGIVLGVLLKLKRTDLNRTVWIGAGSAIIASLLSAVLLNLFGLEFEGRNEEMFEGIVILLAAGVLTWMIFWMHNSAGTLREELEEKTKDAITGKGEKALFSLAFLAVFREGIELALFLLAVQQTASPFQTFIGALLGLGAAVILGIFFFNSTRKLNLNTFFKITNILLIVFASGMVAYGVHELNEAGIIPSIIEHIWDINHILNDKSQVGLILKALVGYNGNPSLTEVIAYLAYIGGISTYVATRREKAWVAALNAAA